MTRGWGRLGAVAFGWVGLGTGQALAQEQPPPPAQQVAASNVTSYRPDFFSQFRPNTALDMVGRIPGFSFDGGSSARGFSGTAGNVLIDGERPPSRTDSLSSIIARIPASGVERIDVIRGGAEGIDMQGKAIVANVIRKKDAGLAGSVSTGINVSEIGKATPSATLQLRSQADGQLFEGSLSVRRNENRNENHRVRVDPAGTVLRERESRSDNVYDYVEATGAWETTWLGGTIRLNGLINGSHFEADAGSSIVVPGGQQDSGGTDDDIGGEAGARFTRSLDGGYSLELVGFQSLKSSDSSGNFNSSGIAGQADFTSGNSNQTNSGESIARAKLQGPAIGDWTFEGGGESVFNFSEREAGFTFNGAPVLLGGNQNRVEELRAEGFLTGTWAPSANLNVETGLRYEWSQITAESDAGNSEKSLTYLKPRVNVSWTPMEGTQFGARVERIVDQLDFGSFASSAEFERQIFGVGNPDAEPEKRWETVLRYEQQLGGQSNLVVSYTHQAYEDVLGRTILIIPGTPPDPDEEFEITLNDGDGTADFVDVSSTWELDAIGIAGGILSVGGSLRDSKVTDPVTGEDHDVAYTYPWSWNVSLQQTFGNGDFRWAVFLEDDDDNFDWSPHEINRFHGGLFLGANIVWKPLPGWSFGAGVNNILAEDGEAEFRFFQNPRTAGAVPTYTEFDNNPNYRTFFVNMRKNF